MIESNEQKVRRLRLRAEEMRTVASGMHHPDASRDLVGAAAQLDRMANRAEEQQGIVAVAAASESHPDKPRRRVRRGDRYSSRRAKFLSMES